MDYAGEHARHRAEHASRAAAAAAHASYYSHPSLHLHTYLSKTGPEAEAVAVNQDGQIVGALNEAYITEGGAPEKERDVSNLPRVNANDSKGRKTGNEGTKEEEGGKEDAGKPSGLDRGALEKGGEAGGTRTSPGPSAQQVQEYLQTQGEWHSWNAKQPQQQQPNGVTNGHGGGGENGLEPPVRPGMGKYASVSQRMNPHLQLMCGPLLAYYTVKDDVWQGAAMVVVRDEGSILQPLPLLTLTFHPYVSPLPSATPSHEKSNGGYPSTTISATKIHTYTSKEGNMSFFRFIIEVPLQHSETTVNYRLNGGAGIEFVVPAKGQNLRWAAHSCNGFSSGVNPDDFKGNYASGYDPVWEDMLLKHHQKPFHCMVGGGDQIYCDAITREPELQGWINAPNKKEKLGTPLTEEIKHAVDRFYFNHYCKIFRSNAFGRANSTIPMVNMLDDHDLIDGFGTYDDETQAAPVMSYVGSRGYFWFLLFQLFVVDAFDGCNPIPGTHMAKSMIVGSANGPWIPFPTHSLLVYLGPKVALLALDCRAERKLDRICTKDTYEKAFGEVKKIGPGLEQLVILLGVPIAYPRMSFLEHFLDLKWNPINVLARHNAFGLGGMVNKFNQASELLDDLNDHWCANTHKVERNWLVLTCQHLAKSLHVRITFLSGDVHLAAVGCLFTYKKKESDRLKPEEDHRYMLNVVTSAIVNTPPPPGAAKMVGKLGGHKHRTLPEHTDECMLPIFDKDTDGSNWKHKLVQPRRNYAIVEYKPTTEGSGELEFEYRVEKSQGAGETVSYAVRAPAPKYKV